MVREPVYRSFINARTGALGGLAISLAATASTLINRPDLLEKYTALEIANSAAKVTGLYTLGCAALGHL